MINKPITDTLPVNTKQLRHMFSRIQISSTSFYKEMPCWEWQGYVSPFGYGKASYTRERGKRKIYPAHRLMYQLFVGLIPDNLVADHLCKNTVCVNPVHIEPVTQKVNVMRGDGLAAKNTKKTHCKHGHPLIEPNLDKYQLAKGIRMCRACKNRRQAAINLRNQKLEEVTCHIAKKPV